MTDAERKEALKDSAEVGLDLTKQFITLAIGALGFVVAGAVSGAFLLPYRVLLWSLLFLAASIALGLGVIMRVINLKQRGVCDINEVRVRVLAMLQIGLFSAAIIILGLHTINNYGGAAAKQQQPTAIRISSGSNEVSYPLVAPSEVVIKVAGPDQIDLKVTPAKP